MAEFQWWLLIVGLVAGGGLVFVVSMDGRRRDEDIQGIEREAEATWIADQLAARDREPIVDPETVEAVLRVHREYLSLPPPDRLVIEGDDAAAWSSSADWDPDREPSHSDADRAPHDVRDDGRGRADEDLASAAEQEAPARQEAHAGADREQRSD
jgi:hypothetical protein